jgi:hypothetical protein
MVDAVTESKTLPQFEGVRFVVTMVEVTSALFDRI